MKKNYKCIKSLYKSTYEANAFTEGKIYESPDIYNGYKDLIFIIDDYNREFSFAKEKIIPYYHFYDYFKEI